MKVGDLVILSKYGVDRGYNNGITLTDPLQTGIIIRIRENAAYPYEVKWSKYPQGKYGHMRRELKYAYRSKS